MGAQPEDEHEGGHGEEGHGHGEGHGEHHGNACCNHVLGGLIASVVLLCVTPLYIVGISMTSGIDHPTHFEKEEHHGEEHSHNIFEEESGFSMHMESLACILMMLVAATLVFEYAKEFIEHYLHTKHYMFELQVLERTMAELAILGFVSFVLFMIRDQKYFSRAIADITGDDYLQVREILHQIHLLLFVILILYIFMVMTVTLLANRAVKSWEHTESTTTSGIIYNILNFPFKLLFDNKIYKKQFMELEDAFHYAPPEQYTKFSEENSHLRTENSRFIAFMHHVTEQVMLHMVDLHWHIWIFIFMVALVCFCILRLVNYSPQERKYVLMIFSFFGHMLNIVIGCVQLRLFLLIRKFAKVNSGQRNNNDNDGGKDDQPLLNNNKAKQMNKMMWFKREPRYLADMVQGSMFCMCIFVAVTALFSKNMYEYAGVWTLFVAWTAPPIFACFLPFVIPNFTTVVGLGGGGFLEKKHHK